MSARTSIENCWDRATPVAPLLDAYRAEVLREAADLLRDLHFDQGYSVQEIGTALRHMATTAEETIR